MLFLDETLQGGSQPLHVLDPSKPSVSGDRDSAFFLGHDHAEGVAQFGQTEGGAVTRADVCELLEVLGKRQMGGKPHKAFPGDDHRAVVPRGARIEDAFEQGLADLAAEFDAAHDMPPYGILAFDDQKRADSVLREIGRGPYQYVDGLRAQRPLVFRCQTPHRDALEKLPELFLKDDHDDDQKNGEEPLKDPGRQLEIQIAGENINRGDDEDAPDDEGCAGVLDPDNRRIKQ